MVGRPYVIENVEDARPELRDPLMICWTHALTGRHGPRRRRDPAVDEAAPAVRVQRAAVAGR
jgi:hypothetical protein